MAGREHRFGIRLGLSLCTEPARRTPRHPFGAWQAARRIRKHQCQVWARGNRVDYDGWAEAGNAGWDTVLPLFKKSEDWEDGESEFRGAGGPIHVERARDLYPVAATFIEAGRSYGMAYSMT